MAEASLFVMDLPAERYNSASAPRVSHINIGSGSDIAILELAELIAKVTGFSGEIRADPSKPDGTPLKLLDISRLTELGWSARIDLETGIRSTYEWFEQNEHALRC